MPVPNTLLQSAWLRQDKSIFITPASFKRLRKDFRKQVHAIVAAIVEADKAIGLSITTFEEKLDKFNTLAEPITHKGYVSGDPYGRIAFKLARMKSLVVMEASEATFFID